MVELDKERAVQVDVAPALGNAIPIVVRDPARELVLLARDGGEPGAPRDIIDPRDVSPRFRSRTSRAAIPCSMAVRARLPGPDGCLPRPGNFSDNEA